MATLVRNVAQAWEMLLSIPRWFSALFAIDLTNKNYAHLPEGLGDYGQGCGAFLATSASFQPELDERPTIDGRNAALINRAGVYDGSAYHDFGHLQVRESTAHSFYAGDTYLHPWEGRTEPIDPAEGHEQGTYSWAKSPRHEMPGKGSMPLEVGPLARQVIAGRPGATTHQDHDPLFLDAIQKVGPSILVRVMARMHEACKYSALAQQRLSEIDLHAPFYSKPVEHSSGRGFGSTEAARGSFSDWLVIDQGTIANDQVATPTAWNIGPQDAKNVHGPMEQSFIGAPIKDPTDPVEMGHVARSYDSCLVCTVHAYDGKTGRELASFRIGETG